ncbi:26S proteasome non-ATPase regulatory subunit 12-like protein [Leptotrombidium deliense]|uniref:26S proteasome non-ATPase regulatory subunit 12-like protein n=1 Tax=Leptotrombidium deliense TaxID=299467 RepID=A0A443SIS8_9ACAR|nr:26S proteasome non-ATPase regulatory subunit 12-like protein [Leptotrombidium deliense]
MGSEGFTDSGKLLKMEVDYSATVDEKIPVCELLTKGADTHSTSRILTAIVQLCFEAKNWKSLNENIILLTKRRSQIKQSVTKMIQACCGFVEQTPDKETKLALIDTLRTVTAGKIYVEVERARLTYTLARMKEAEGNIEEAANILQELQVETFGSMEKREKVELILEQMRLCLAKKDHTRTQIISKKITTKFFDDSSVQDLKLKYYNLMIELDSQESAYLSICKHFRAVFNTPTVQSDSIKKHEALKNIVLYIVLSPFGNEQSDLIHRITSEKALDEIPKYKEVLDLFTTAELINWNYFGQSFENILRKGTDDCPATGVFSYNEIGSKRWNDLKGRVVEHNIRIMAKYYHRVGLRRMAHLLDLSVEDTEEVLSNLVVNKTIWAKVDRLGAVVNFAAHKDPNEVLNDWSHNINMLMKHSIQKESNKVCFSIVLKYCSYATHIYVKMADDDKNETKSIEEEDDDDDERVTFEGAYDPCEFENLDVSPEIRNLFNYITCYTPQLIDLDLKHRPFIPDYIPAVGDIDAFIKVSSF